MKLNRFAPSALRLSLSVALLGLVLLTGTVASADDPVGAGDWPHYRGLAFDGQARPGTLEPGKVGLELTWKRSLGSSYSSISIVGDQVVAMYTDGEKDLVGAFAAADGSELWRYEIGPMYAGHDGSHDGPISTPTIHQGKVYGLGGKGELFAVLLADGSEVWRRQLEEGEATKPFYGFTTAPLVAGDLLIVATGAAEGHSVTAVRLADGKTAWAIGNDSVTYQSPSWVEIAGHRQLVVPTNQLLLGLDPESGKELWSLRHNDSEEGTGSGTPVLLGNDRVLLEIDNEAMAVQISKQGDTWKAEEIWRSDDIKRSFAVPVLVDGYLYAFNGRFLTCVDPATGESVWKSRPPGGRGLIAVDGHLVLLGSEGDLVVVEASPEGYKEAARLALFDDAGWTAPSFAHGHIYVRNLTDMASIRITDTPAPKADAKADLGLGGKLGKEMTGVLELPEGERQAAVDKLLADHSGGPVIEDDGWVHFIYRGDAEDVALAGSVLGTGSEQTLNRIAGTDLFVRSLELDPDGHYEYRFDLDFGNPTPDPANPLAIGSLFGPSSELRMPGWKVPAHVAEPAEDQPRGRLDSFQFYSEILDNRREIKVYLPAGYNRAGDKRFPLVIFNNGDSAVSQGSVEQSLDNLVGKEVAPLVVAFVPRAQRQEYGGESSANYARMLAEELIPHLDRHYRTLGTAESRLGMGVGSGSWVAVFSALETPGVYGAVATQSYYSQAEHEEAVQDKIAKVAKKPRFYVELSSNDYLQPPNLDAQADSRALAERLEGAGFEVVRNEIAGAAGWGSWRAQLDVILSTFFPYVEDSVEGQQG